MKIVILANRDLPSNQALNELLPVLAEKHDLEVFLSSHVGSHKDLPAPLQMLRFFEQTLFNDIVFEATEQLHSGAAPYSFKQLARFTQSPIAVLNGINTPAGLTTLASSHPDLIISIRYGGILREQAIAVPEQGVINLHSGLLPDYRGVMATFRALSNAEHEIGTTLHYISDPGIDTGEIIGQTRLPVAAGRSYLWHVLQLYPPACSLLAETVAQIDAGQRPLARPQPPGGHYYSFPDEADITHFLRAGYTLYDTDDITDIARAYLGHQKPA